MWRPSTGTWYSIDTSGSKHLSLNWGVSTDTPVIGDYDGDGKTDIASMASLERDVVHHSKLNRQVVWRAVWKTG